MLVEVIEQLPQKGYLASRFPPGNQSADIKMGAQLIVQENQAAVFYRDGKAMDVFRAGRHSLTSMNLPVVSKLLGAVFQGGSPFRASVVYVDLGRKLNLKWGTTSPIPFLDQKYDLGIKVRAHGTYHIKISDPLLFVGEYYRVNADGGKLHKKVLEDDMRSAILTNCNSLIQEAANKYQEKTGTPISAYNILSLQNFLSSMVKSKLEDDFAQFGVQLINFYVESMNVPKEDMERLQERQEEWSSEDRAATRSQEQLAKFAMRERSRITGDMGEAMKAAAQNEGGAGGGMGLAMGAGMGFMMPQMMMQQQGYGRGGYPQQGYGYPPQQGYGYPPQQGYPQQGPQGGPPPQGQGQGGPPQGGPPQGQPVAQQGGGESLQDKLAKLKTLVEQGLISEEDAQARKLQILDEMGL